MAKFEHDGVSLAYDDVQPPGDPERTLVLVHGFSSNRNEGWKRTGWYSALGRRGMRVIALDQRGHGESDKPHDPALYGRGALASDVIALMDHLGVGRADLLGFSMGSHVSLNAAMAAPERFSNLILGGVGDKLLAEPAGAGPGNPMATALRAADPETVEDPMLRSFRHFADEQGEDREALAALAEASNTPLDPAALWDLPMPVLAVAGQREPNGDPELLARSFPFGRGVIVPGCDHFSAIPHALTKAAVFDFLDGLLDDPQ